MRKHAAAILSIMLALLLLLCSCEDSPGNSKPGDVIVFNSNISVFMNSTEKTLTNVYKTDYFRRDSTAGFDKELALLSLPVAAPSDRETAMANIVAMGFDNIQKHWNTDEFYLHCSYIIGHRTVDEYELIVVYLNYVNYDVEWASNLEIGASGNHYGFDEGAQQVYKALKKYVKEYYPDKPLKLWLTGYSRGGGLSDALAYKILEDKVDNQRVLNVAEKDMYAYSFESPASIAKKVGEVDTTTYSCIHCIAVDSDLIAALPPTGYGLKCPGKIVPLSGDPENLNNLLHKYISTDLSMPVFTETTESFKPLGGNFKTPEQFVSFFLENLVKEDGDLEHINLFRDRGTFHTEVEGRLSYLLQVLMRQKRVGLNALVNYVNEKGAQTVFAKWITEDGFYNDLYPILDSCSVEYYDAKLKNACSLLPSLYDSDMMLKLVQIIGLGTEAIAKLKDNALYTIYSHCPEVFYVLLKEYEVN